MNFIDKIYQKNPTVITRKIDEDIVLVPTQQQTRSFESIFTLNDMAAGIWVQIDGQTSVRIIEKRILSKFKANPRQIKKDLMDFLLQLENLHMILC